MRILNLARISALGLWIFVYTTNPNVFGIKCDMFNTVSNIAYADPAKDKKKKPAATTKKTGKIVKFAYSTKGEKI